MAGVASKRAGFLSSPIVAIVSVIVALALIVTVGITAKNKFLPNDSVTDTSKALPVDFPSSLTPVDSPLVKRAEKVTFQIQAPTGLDVKTFEVWDDGRPYLSWSPEKGDKPKGAPVFDVTSTEFDYVPTTAGQHVLTARLIAADGKISVAAPFVVPALDRAEDLYEKPPTVVVDGVEKPNSERMKRASLSPSPGETPKQLASRLGVGVKNLNPVPTSKSLSLPYAPGTVIDYKFPSAADATKKLNAKKPGSLADKAGITATVKDCAATVTLKDSVGDGKVALFATTPLKPGYLQIGSLEKGKPFKTSGLPIGKTSLMAYSSELGLTAAIPVSITIPDDCSSLGWTGDAKIVNGLLMTEKSVDRPYAYVSVDRGEWQRYPAGQGNYLQSGSINSVTAYMSTTKWNQLDVRVWSFDGSQAAQAASGTFCRKNMPNPDQWNGTDSNEGCRSPGPLPQDGTVNATKGSLSIKASLGDIGAVGDAISSGGSSVPGFDEVTGYTPEPVSDDPSVTQTIQLRSDLPVTLEAAASEQVKRISYQFSLFPISQNTTSLHPPGVFFVAENKGTKTKVNPYKWRDAKLPGTDGDDQGLSFDDALSLELAKANMASDHNLLTTLYVRAVATDNQCLDKCLDNGQTGNQYSIGIASNSIKIDMADEKKWIQVKPTASVKPGIDTSFPKEATRGKCFSILDYPDTSSYRMFPGSAPYVEKPVAEQIFGEPKVATKIVKNESYRINANVSDRAIAIRDWGEETNVVHCLDPEADAIFKASSDAAKAKKEAECGLACQATAVLFGFAVGFAVGGPAGAVIGAAAGYYFADDLKGATKALNELLITYYDLISMFYNQMRTDFVEAIAKFNPVCVAIKSGGADAYKACSTVVTVVVQAVITYYTGLPPTVPTSQAARAIANGEAEAWLATGIEVAMRQIPGVGAACDTLTLDEETVEGMSTAGGLADGLGANGIQKLVDDSRRSKEAGGGISACNLVAKAVARALSDKMNTFYSGQVGAAMELPYGLPPGTASEPVTDTTPEIIIETPTSLFTSLQTCPITANVRVLLDGGVDGDKVLYTLRPIRSTLKTVPGAKKQRASIRIPVLPDSRAFPPSAQTLEPSYPKDDPKYLNVQVNSPCFKDTNLVFEFDKKGGSFPAFVDDDRPSDFYYMVVK
ncbi:hypothetical protein J2X11_000847 [Aeromicrobium panaciterrae]|uniref:Uncharacterized protein n=1 Tax=Aeromicrobium panaciterrae TaxID=363861 RepID=A0ABU1ULH9_9ACTN|nr:hypothetical protein [Aeromicrobium panaciterrae]MDR7086008.1 hypothetical protein [Aeromicrobium panaciterrae]